MSSTDTPPTEPPAARVLFAAYPCYLDNSSGAAVASRSLLEGLARRGIAVEALSGSRWDSGRYHEIEESTAADLGTAWSFDSSGMRSLEAPQVRLTVHGVPVTLYRGRPSDDALSDQERAEFLGIYEKTLDRFRPRCIVTYEGDVLDDALRSQARARGIAVVFALHNFGYRTRDTFANVDAVIVPSRFAADHYRRSIGLKCTALPNLIDLERVRTETRRPEYLTFVNPSPEKGVFALARIADELGRKRPDIPVLVVESRGTERTLVDCGLDLRDHGNVHLMTHTPDPRHFWEVTRVCLLPSLWWENQPLVAIEAMVNGIPVIGSDRGRIPETLGNSGVVLPLPERLMPYSRELPTGEEVSPWIEAICRLWDDPELMEEHARRARIEALRWSSDLLEAQSARFIREVTPSSAPPFVQPTSSVGPVELDSPWAQRASSWDQIPGMFDFAAVYDAAVESAPDGAVFVEVGCLAGRSTCYLAAKIRESGKAITLYAVDTGRGSASDMTGQDIAPSLGGSMAGVFHCNLISCGVDDLVVPIFTTSVRAANLFQAGSVDLCFIDADHSYESVMEDLRTWWPKVKPGGILAGHDYRQTAHWLLGVTPAVHEFFGVADAGHPLCPSCWTATKPSDSEANLVSTLDGRG
ncbi:class I SAM-dependent methyltransferase [Paludisphaera borealis]|uniref:GT4 family glycosyltransferase n=1 Tax=Paludisphaera borealis TaxID=1387353 RepID=A0A1U7CPG1_9BACT|nr:class I SAM-dependent methyltransferase [Paludisphaera borealis]APW60822.1 GT4 family glycosyltransferase [Paludisphaera borealis]